MLLIVKKNSRRILSVEQYPNASSAFLCPEIIHFDFRASWVHRGLSFLLALMRGKDFSCGGGVGW